VSHKSAEGKAKNHSSPGADPSGLGRSWPFRRLIFVTEHPVSNWIITCNFKLI
jgi:hypothetical protein